MKLFRNIAATLILLISFMLTSYANSYVMHTVEQGDTYWKLSNNYKLNVNNLLNTNNTSNTNLMVGKLIKIKPLNKTISIYVNNNVLQLDAKPYLEDDRTFVPVRFIAEALDAQVSWDSENYIAIIVKGDKKIYLPINSKVASVNDINYTLDAPVQLFEDRTFVPVRFVSEVLDCDVEWDGANYYVNIYNSNIENISSEKIQSYSDEDLYWLSRIVEAEASGESFEGKLAVANVVINRKNSYEYPNTIKGVVFDNMYGYQFTPVKNGTIYNSPSNDSIIAATQSLQGTNNVSECLYFINPDKSTHSWIRNNRSFYKEIGDHDFYL